MDTSNKILGRPIGILALQGDFAAHGLSIEALGQPWVEIRYPRQIMEISGLILPGGESTTLTKLLNQSSFLEEIKSAVRRGMPVYGSCAGAILLSQEVIGNETATLGLIRAGKLRLLAVPSPERNPVVPDVPTAKEQGFDAVQELFRGLSVPKGTPEAIKAKLTDAMVKAANSEAFMALGTKKGFTVQTMNEADFNAMLEAEDAKVVSVMRKAGLYQSKSK